MEEEYDPMDRLRQAFYYFLISFPIIALIAFLYKYGEGLIRWFKSLF